MIRRPPRSTPLYSSAASDVYKRQIVEAIKKVGDAGGYTYVMEATMMLYSGPSAVDITAQVKKQLGL